MLLANHPDKDGKPRVKLDADSFRRIVQWLDVNAIFYGDYSWNKAEWRCNTCWVRKARQEYLDQR